MTPLKNYLTLKGYDVVSFDIYDYDNPKDTDYKKWIRRCEEQIRKALEDGRPITLLGFSMGGVIASLFSLCLSDPTADPVCASL